MHHQQQQREQELLYHQQHQKANEMADDGSPISPEKVPTLNAAEFERQQQVLERNIGTAGGVGVTMAAAAAAGGVGKEQPPAAAAARRAAEEREKEAAVAQARAAYDAPPPPPPPPPTMEMPSKEEMAMKFRQSEERAEDTAQNQRLPNELEEEDGRKQQELALENASIGGGAPALMATPGGEVAAVEREGEGENRQQS